MVRLVPGGNIPTIRLQGRSLDMMDAGAPASKPLETSIKAAKTERSRWRRSNRNDAAFSNGTELARLRQAQQSSTSGAWLGELQ
jgi:hypothetical protein